MSDLARLQRLVRDVPDFPTKGIVFKDITPLLADARAFRDALDAMAAPFRDSNITHVAAIESRGFILGAPIAERLSAGFIPVRKPGKLPFTSMSEDYELEYGTGRLEIHTDACSVEKGNARVLLVDDVLATGGTAAAACSLIERVGGEVVGLSFLITLDFLPGRERLSGRRVETVLRYA